MKQRTRVAEIRTGNGTTGRTYSTPTSLISARRLLISRSFQSQTVTRSWMLYPATAGSCCR